MTLGETIQKGDQHITVTLHPEMYAQSALKQYKKTIKIIGSLLEAYSDRFVAVAELTRHGNIHYHAVVSWRAANEYAQDMFKDDMKSLSKIFGNIMFNDHVIENEKERQRVINYITKEIPKTQRILNKRRSKFQVEPYISWARSSERNPSYGQHVDYGCLDIINPEAVNVMDFDQL